VSSYALEISSPGIGRRLSRPEHYSWAIGKLVEIDSGDKKTQGYIRDVKKDGVVIATDSGEVLFTYKSIVRAKLVEELLYDKRR
jgi:ribosome maturation factor RimP